METNFYPMEVLQKAESVLMQRIRKMKDGEPKYAASEKLREIRDVMVVVKKQFIKSMDSSDN
jgi:hypothetical protein